MIKFLLLGTFLILGVISCGCISTQQPIVDNFPINSTTGTVIPATAPVVVQSNPVTESFTPSPERASFEKGVSLYNQKKYSESIIELNTTLSLNATNGDAYMARGKAFYQIGRMKAYEVRGDEEFNQTISDCSQALVYSVNSEEVLTLRGWSYYWKGINLGFRHTDGKYARACFPLFELAGSDFSQVIRINPENIDALNGRALAYSQIGRGSKEVEYQYNSQKMELAQKDVQLAYYLDPKNPWTNFALWQVDRYQKESPDIQIKKLDEAILIDPDEAWFYWQRGAVKWNMGDYESSLVDINKALELQPRFVFAYGSLAQLYIQQQKYDEALVTAQKALEINPNLGVCWSNFAWAQYLFLTIRTSASLDECIISIDRAIAMDPESGNYHWSRYIFLTWADRWDEAREELKMVKNLALTNEEKLKVEREEMNLATSPQYISNLIRY
jgi:tetratricopeptide (TPR) repeat protein